MKLNLTSVFSIIGAVALLAPACAATGTLNGDTGGAAETGGSTAVAGGAGKLGGSGGSQASAAGNGGASNSGGASAIGTGGASGSGGSGSAMPPPNSVGDVPNLHVLAWNGHQAAVSLSFDDGDPSQFLAKPVLDARGIKATFFVVMNGVEGGGLASRNGFAAFLNAGHELANHTVTHASSADGTASEVTDCDAYLRIQFGIEPSTFAYPNTNVTATYKDAAAALYVASRNAGSGNHIAVDENPDFHELPSYFIGDSDAHPVSEGIAALDETLAAGAWRIITIHGIGQNGWYANLSVENLTLFVDSMNGKDFWIDTFARVAGYLRAQKELEGALPVQTGAGTTWTWTLPPGFPADVRLRVLIDGGTLTQGGQAVVWNGSEGYYPVDPKALSLTWSP